MAVAPCVYVAGWQRGPVCGSLPIHTGPASPRPCSAPSVKDILGLIRCLQPPQQNRRHVALFGPRKCTVAQLVGVRKYFIQEHRVCE